MVFVQASDARESLDRTKILTLSRCQTCKVGSNVQIITAYTSELIVEWMLAHPYFECIIAHMFNHVKRACRCVEIHLFGWQAKTTWDRKEADA
jgi:hypothetical protein